MCQRVNRDVCVMSRGHEQKPKGEHSHVNKALQEAMNAEKAAMHR